MNEFFTLRWRPTAETVRATAYVIGFIVVLGTMNGFAAPRLGRVVAGSTITAFYLVMYFATLAFVGRRANFSAVGISARRALPAIIVGLVIGGVGLLGTVRLFPQGSFAVPAWQSLSVLLMTGLSVGFIENLVFHGYFQFRIEEAFGPALAVLAGASAWTLFHAAVLSTPGAGTYAATRIGSTTLLVNLFVTFLLIGLTVQLTRNIWSGVVQNAVVGNVLVNLYMLSVMPNEVLIADPKSFPVALGLAVLVVLGLMLTKRTLAGRST